MNDKSLILFIEAQADLLDDEKTTVAIREILITFLLGVENQLLYRKDCIIRHWGNPRVVNELKLWLEQNGQEKWFRFSDPMIQLDESNLSKEDRQRIVRAIQRVLPPKDRFHAYPSRFGILTRIRNLFRGD